VDKELIIRSTPTEVDIALLENKKLVELHSESKDVNFSVGDIFLGSIKMLRPGLNAAFLDIGIGKKDAFLHYTDIGPQIKSLCKYTAMSCNKQYNTHILENFPLEPDNPKNGRIENVFKRGNLVLVQILKEPISTKGPRLTCEITLPGRYMVMTPFNNVVAVSKKITDQEERKRLKYLVESIKPKNFGVIVRTAAVGKKVADLHEEIRKLMDNWRKIHKELEANGKPGKLLSELDKTSSLVRDLMNDSFNRIVTDNRDLHHTLKTYIKGVSPTQEKIVNLHNSKVPIFEKYRVNRQIKSSFGKTYTMPSGAYLIIEHTEAMHVIDVNSGPKAQKRNQEDAAIAVNLEAAEEIARQLRLRDIGGLIIIDFIDMRNFNNKQALVKAMKEFMKNDRAQHTILSLSKFGLMQITRQRVRPELEINNLEQCPSCLGTGKVTPSIVLGDEIERSVDYIISSHPKAKIALKVHPYIHSYFTKGIFSKQWSWFMKYKKWIKLIPMEDFHLNEFKFIDVYNDEIRLN